MIIHMRIWGYSTTCIPGSPRRDVSGGGPWSVPRESGPSPDVVRGAAARDRTPWGLLGTGMHVARLCLPPVLACQLQSGGIHICSLFGVWFFVAFGIFPRSGGPGKLVCLLIACSLGFWLPRGRGGRRSSRRPSCRRCRGRCWSASRTSGGHSGSNTGGVRGGAYRGHVGLEVLLKLV